MCQNRLCFFGGLQRGCCLLAVLAHAPLLRVQQCGPVLVGVDPVSGAADGLLAIGPPALAHALAAWCCYKCHPFQAAKTAHFAQKWHSCRPAGAPEPVLLDVSSIAPDRILLLDAYFYVVGSFWAFGCHPQ